MNGSRSNEKILMIYNHAGYEIPENIKNWNLRFRPYLDVGILYLTNLRLYFKGKKVRINIDRDMITYISLVGAKGVKVNYIRIAYRESGQLKRELFLPDTVSIFSWEINDLSDKLYLYLRFTWLGNKDFKKKINLN